uniref:Uncharacterized protein n=1 Tax=Picea glauca TaxID=3330 RepID=A0A101LYN5_PICGL|nr:hypothetical protein ABT39_MTgene5956 [Picea glauca]
MIPFFKRKLRAMFIYLLLHSILSQNKLSLSVLRMAALVLSVRSTYSTLDVPSKCKATEGSF